MGFPRQEHRSGLPFPSPRDLLDPGIEPRSPALQADSLPSETPGKPKNTGVGSLSLAPGDLLYPGMEPGSLALQVNSLSAELPGQSDAIYREPAMYKFVNLAKSLDLSFPTCVKEFLTR